MEWDTVEGDRDSITMDWEPAELVSVDGLAASMDQLSTGEHSIPVCVVHMMAPCRSVQVNESQVLHTLSCKDTSQERPLDDVLSPEDTRTETKECMVIESDSEERETHVPKVEEKHEGERTETSEKVEKSKPRQGGVLHRSENSCCLIPQSPTVPQSLGVLLMDDIKSADQTPRP